MGGAPPVESAAAAAAATAVELLAFIMALDSTSWSTAAAIDVAILAKAPSELVVSAGLMVSMRVATLATTSACKGSGVGMGWWW